MVVRPLDSVGSESKMFNSNLCCGGGGGGYSPSALSAAEEDSGAACGARHLTS